MDEMVILNKVRGYRNQLGFTQEYMADLLNITQSTYSSKENGKTAFNQKEMRVILNKFKKYIPEISIEDLFF